MRNSHKHLLVLVLSLILLFGTPVSMQAQGVEPPPGTVDVVSVPPPEDADWTTPPPRSEGESFLSNPLVVNSLEDFLVLLVEVLIILATPVIVFFIIYSGSLFVTAQGNDDKLKKAKNALLWTIIGGVILLGANLILEVIKNTVDSLST